MHLPSTETDNTRITFLDNLRYLMIVLLVLFHTANAYTNITSWWYVWDYSTDAAFLTAYLILFDAFAMATLFFIAGYFSLVSIRRYGAFVFVRNKLIHLGIPCLIGVLFLAPVCSYIGYYKHLNGQQLLGYGQFWVNWVGAAAGFQTGFRYYTDLNKFGQAAYWFISLLLFFSMIFSILFVLKDKVPFAARVRKDEMQTGKKKLLVMLLVVCLCVFTYYINLHISYPTQDPWAIILSVLQFQVFQLPVYAIYFGLGVYACSGNWFTRDNHFPGRPVFWAAVCAALSVAYLVILVRLLSDMQNTGLQMMAGVAGNFLTAAYLIVFMSLAPRYWNRPNKINESLAANSYNIYLIHLPIVVVLQLLLTHLPGIDSVMTFAAVFVVAFSTSYALSKYGLKKHPRLSIIAAGVIFLLMAVFVHPRA